jgi:response regulator RpfG family c-di-GMP phosphodiesterase
LALISKDRSYQLAAVRRQHGERHSLSAPESDPAGAEIAAALGRRMGMAGAEADDLHYGALLHDVGRIAMNHQELAGRASTHLSESSMAEAHVLLGAQLLAGVKRFKGVTPIVRHHHEHWDGTGFPDRLSGEEIPLGARIVGLVEDLEELRFSSLPESDLKPLMIQRAKNGSGTLFDPAVVEAYLSLESAAASSVGSPPVIF